MNPAGFTDTERGDRLRFAAAPATGCLLAAATYLPIYHEMVKVVGKGVVGGRSTRNPATGAITLTPMASDATGTLVAATGAVHSNNQSSSCWSLYR
jgi:hypothetical protein